MKCIPVTIDTQPYKDECNKEFDWNLLTVSLFCFSHHKQTYFFQVLISSRQDIESLKIGASIATAQLNSLGGHTTFAICP